MKVNNEVANAIYGDYGRLILKILEKEGFSVLFKKGGEAYLKGGYDQSYKTFFICDNGGEFNFGLVNDEEKMVSIPYTYFGSILSPETILYRIQKALNSEPIDYEVKIPHEAQMSDSQHTEQSDLQGAKKYQVVLATLGNIDHGQDPDEPLFGVPNQIVPVDTLEEASETCRTYIDNYELGAGNWNGGYVYENRVQAAYISYNGRIWKKGSDYFREIPFDKWLD